MVKIKKTLGGLNDIQRVLRSIDLEPNDKLTYAVKKVNAAIEKAVTPVMASLSEKMADAKATFAATGEKGIILTDDNGNYQYTARGAKDLATKTTEILKAHEATEIEFEPFYSPSCERLLELDMFSLEILAGVIVDPEMLVEGEIKKI